MLLSLFKPRFWVWGGKALRLSAVLRTMYRVYFRNKIVAVDVVFDHLTEVGLSFPPFEYCIVNEGNHN